jgi:tetratricopeptide (TPR) repeat protein
MVQDIFLARTEEQQQFRRSLTALMPSGPRRHFPTFTKMLPKPAPVAPAPSVLLFYGPGGMGKTTLTQRLQTIATTDAAFKSQVNALFLDWEQVQKLTGDLQVGHDNIEPITVLQVLHKALVEAGWGKHFGDYDKALKALDQAETKVNKAMQGQPDHSLPDQVSKLGAKGIAYLIRAQPGAGSISQEVLESTLDTTFKVTAEGLYQARQFAQRALSPQEYTLYEQPNQKLAEALGQGIAKASQAQPLVLLFDTYEIVDRPDCDYTLRRVIETSGDKTLWVVAGRNNLADSGQRGRSYFRGYKRDFPEERVYAKGLSEFGLDLIQQYFQSVTPDQPISEAQADAVARFSLGIPFVIRQAAVMWREGKPIAEIVTPVVTPLGRSAYDEVIHETSERFLVHCFGSPERDADLEAIYALALMRRPDAELLRQMLDERDLEARLQRLKQRYGFIWVEQLRLDEKLAQFLRAYLLNDLRRTSRQVQTLNDRAMTWLELQVEALGRGIEDTAEKLETEAWAETVLDLAHHRFWRGEEAGMRYVVPRFVEGWQYDRNRTRSLLALTEDFKATFAKDNQKRLERFEAVLDFDPDPEQVTAVLADLEKLTQRSWLVGGGEVERDIILLMQRGQLFYQTNQYPQALACYLPVANQLPATAQKLRRDLASYFYHLSSRFIWPDNASSAIYSPQGEQAARKAVVLDASEGDYYNNLGVVLQGVKHYEEAATVYQNAIDLDPKEAIYYHNFGNIYQVQERYGDAITAYHKAIELDPKLAAPHNGIGNVYQDQERYGDAITAYHKAIELDPKLAAPHNGIGNVYQAQERYGDAIAAYHKAIELDPKFAAPHNGIGNVYQAQERYGDAIAAYHKAIELDPKFAAPHNGIGNVYQAQERYGDAIAAYEKAIETDPKYAYPHSNLGNVYQAQERYEDAISTYEKTLTLLDQPGTPASAHTLAYNGLGNVYQAQERYEDAIAAYEKAIEIDPKYASPHNGIGNVYKAQERYGDAISAYGNAIQLDFEEAIYHNNLGNIYEEQCRYEAALSAYQKAIELSPEWDAPLENLAAVYWLTGDYQKGIEFYGRAVQIVETRYRLNCLGWLYVVVKDYAKASETLGKSIALGKDWANLFNDGLLHALQENWETANTQWQLGLSLGQKEDDFPEAARAFYSIVLGEGDQGIAHLQVLLDQDRIPSDFKRQLLLVAQVMQDCPRLLAPATQAVDLLTKSLNPASAPVSAE